VLVGSQESEDPTRQAAPLLSRVRRRR